MQKWFRRRGREVKRFFMAHIYFRPTEALILQVYVVDYKSFILIMNHSVSCSSNCLKEPIPLLNPPLIPSELSVKILEQSESQKEKVLPKNLKWTDRQHVLYLLFLEENRDKIKSKLIRRSNSFYRDMALFIGNKTGVQCRSHHQKFQTKYKYPHKIIKFEKERVDPILYASVLNNFRDNEEKQQNSPLLESEKFEHTSEVSQKEACCQTEIQGTQTLFVVYQDNLYQHRLMQSNFQPCFPPHGSTYGQWLPSNVFPYPWPQAFP